MNAVAEQIVESLATVGFYVGASIFPDDLTRSLALRAAALAQSGGLNAARVGRGKGKLANAQVRNDETRWLADALRLTRANRARWLPHTGCSLV